ncbi:ankyrin-2-like isoform X2 [Gigantopelta aegis]|uniref:ankyrin-2-like isoform X2 n=1 Tax=Gigantopelta aegis TaxID=1735272 RepID=UPI001B88E315|nr:ankyrin-2-like isoform X2 [Gigantopelta aegis]
MSSRAICGCTVLTSNPKMAPNKEDETICAKGDKIVNVNTSIKSKFVQQICSILVVARILDWYQDLKNKNPLLAFAFSPIEYLVKGPLLFVAGQFGRHFSYIDEKAAQIIATMADTVGQLCQKSLNKNTATPTQRSKTKCVVRSIPGTVITWCVDVVCNLSERLLRKLQTLSRRKPSEDTIQKQFVVQGFQNHGFLYVIVLPLEMYVYLLRYLHRWIHNTDDLSFPPHELLSPEKQAEIQSRRKVSPRKKSRNLLVRLFGLGRPGKLQSISEEMKGELSKSPNKEDAVEKKRKFEDVEDEQESDEDNYGLADRDLENYVSDEDPDYEPDNHDTTDSEEYAEGQTESDIEFEYKDSGYQVIEDSTKSETKTQDTTSDLKQTVTPKIVEGTPPIKSITLRGKAVSKGGFLEGTPPAKTSSPRVKPASIPNESKSKEDSLTTEKKIILSPSKSIQSKSASPQVKVKEESSLNVEENATIQMPTNIGSTEKKAVLQPGKSIQLKPSSPQVKSRDGREKSGQVKSGPFHGKCKDGEENLTQKIEKTTKQKGSKKTENQESLKETKNKGSKGNDGSGDKSGGEKMNGEKPKTETTNTNLTGGDFVSKESKIN